MVRRWIGVAAAVWIASAITPVAVVQAEPHPAYVQGLRLLRADRAAAALPHLREAVQARPRDVEPRYMLAVACIKAGRDGEGWTQVRQAVRLDPNMKPAVSLFHQLWMAYDGKGVNNVGKPIDGVRATLGKPDREVMNAGSGRLEYGYMAVGIRDGRVFGVIDLRDLPRAAMYPKARLQAPLDPKAWRMNHRQFSRISENAEFVPPGQSVQRHSEMFSSQRLLGLGGGKVAIKAMAAQNKAALAAAAPKAVWRVIAINDREYVCEFIVPQGGAHPAQHEISRTVLGEVDAHRVAYVKMGQPMDANQRTQWIDRLTRATLQSSEVAMSSAAPTR